VSLVRFLEVPHKALIHMRAFILIQSLNFIIFTQL